MYSDWRRPFRFLSFIVSLLSLLHLPLLFLFFVSLLLLLPLLPVFLLLLFVFFFVLLCFFPSFSFCPLLFLRFSLFFPLHFFSSFPSCCSSPSSPPHPICLLRPILPFLYLPSSFLHLTPPCILRLRPTPTSRKTSRRDTCHSGPMTSG